MLHNNFFLLDKSTRIYASGPWNGEVLTGVPQLKSQEEDGGFNFTVFWSPEETYYKYSISDPSSRARLVVDGTKLRRLWWENGSWSKSGKSYPADQCDNYALCGPFGYCVNTGDQSPPCSCLPGFKPQWQQGQQAFGQDWSKGCARTTNLTCGTGDGFWPVNKMKLPEATNATVYPGITLDQCRKECLGNGRCMAYAAAANVRGGDSPGCVIWTVDLLDMRENSVVEQDLYIRLAQSEIDSLIAPEKRHRLIRNVVIAVVTTVCSMLLCCCCFWRNKTKWKRHTKMETKWKRKKFSLSPSRDHWFDENNTSAEDDLDLPLFDIEAWMVWKEGRGTELLDKFIGGVFDDTEVLRFIHVALLCVEMELKNRPLMSSVVMMLSSENSILPQPNEPGVSTGNNTSDTKPFHGLTDNIVT
ncbi:hypothetical protein ABZP36_016154, partial [Zizania latifolia]